MALRSLKVTKKELQNYYQPLTSDFERMVDSVNSVMGYGQVIQRYLGLEVLNTYYHVWDNNLGEKVVIDKTSLSYYPEAQAGPMLWGVTSQDGLNFLNGVSSLSGYRKFKYCDGCADKNTIAFQSVNNFKKRFSQISNLITQYNTLDAYLFYDDSLPRFTNVYPAVKEDDGVNVTFRFKNIEGTDKSLSDIEQITGKPVIEIETSIDEAPVVKPQEGSNSLIVSCCDEGIFYVVSGQMKIGATVTSSSYFDGSKSWYIESYTDSDPTIPEGIRFTYNERSCKSGIINNPCGGPPCEQLKLSYSRSPFDVCTQIATDYDFDSTNGILYEFESCGELISKSGVYSDGENLFSWNGINFEKIGKCQQDSVFNGPWVSSIIIPQYTDTFAIPTTTYIGFVGVQDGSPTNAIYAQLQITIDPQIVDGTRNIQRDIYKYEVLELVNSQWVPAMDKNNRPIGYGDYSLDKGGNRNKINYRQVYDPSTSQWTTYEGEYLLLYGSTFAYNGDYYSTRTPFTNQFNQRVFKLLLYPIWEDDTSYYEIIVNAGDTSNTPNIISSASYYQGQQL